MGKLVWIIGPEGRSNWWRERHEDLFKGSCCGPGVSGESEVNVCLTQGSVLSPLLFIAVPGTDKARERKICTKRVFGSVKLVALKTESLLNTFARRRS